MDLLTVLLASGAFSSIVSWVLKLVDKRMEKKAGKDNTMIGLQSAIKSLMYDRIKHIAKTYIERGWCSLEEYEDLKQLHDSYHNDVKGNGFLDNVMKCVEGLPKRAS